MRALALVLRILSAATLAGCASVSNLYPDAESPEEAVARCHAELPACAEPVAVKRSRARNPHWLCACGCSSDADCSAGERCFAAVQVAGAARKRVCAVPPMPGPIGDY